MIKLSVIIPVFNAEKTIQQTIESALKQKEANKEIIIVNDGSTDKTAEVLDRYKKYVVIINNKNGGVSSARNSGLKEAKGDKIAFLDSDDVWHPQYLTFQLKQFEKFPHALASFTGKRKVDGFLGPDFKEDDEIIDEESIELNEFKFLRWYHSRPRDFSPSFLMIDKHKLPEEYLFFPEMLKNAEDHFYFHRLAMVGKIIYCPGKYGYCKNLPTGLTSRKIEQYESTIISFRELKKIYFISGNKKGLQIINKNMGSSYRTLAKIYLENNLRAHAIRILFKSGKENFSFETLLKVLYIFMKVALNRRNPK